MKVTVGVLLTLVAVTQAHNWLASPSSRGGNVASQVDPCDSGAYTAGTSQFTVLSDNSFTITYTTNHADSTNHEVAIALYQDGDDAFVGAAGPFVWTNTYDSSEGGTEATKTVPAPNEPGLYTLQWKWSAWWQCVDFTVLASPPEGSIVAQYDPETFEAIDDPNVYLTADGQGLFNVLTGTLTCSTGWEPAYDDVSGELLGCAATEGVTTEQVAIQITFHYVTDEAITSHSAFESDFITALAEDLGTDPERLVISNTDYISDMEVYITVDIQPGVDGESASVIYSTLLEQYNNPLAPMNTDLLLRHIDNSEELNAETVAPSSATHGAVGIATVLVTLAAAGFLTA